MNVSLQSQDFVKELEVLEKVVSQKPTIPVLANVLIQAEGEGLRLAATDLETGLVTFCPAIVHEPGITTLPVKHLLEVCRLLQGEVSLIQDKSSVKLSAANYTSRLQVYDAKIFPVFPSMHGLPTTTFPNTELREALRQVRFASLNGTYLLDFLKAAVGVMADLSWKNQGAMLFVDGDNYCYVQMPIRGN
jgi:DNA polymerase-3 subunit beta